MFLIVPGAFSEGNVNDELYNGESYMECGEIIFAAPNFRTGILGFTKLDNTDISGNMGLKDLVLALTWVYENISRFGGDPNCIQVFGFSSGNYSNFIFTLKTNIETFNIQSYFQGQ